VNEDNDDYSSDAWLDIDSISLDAGLDLSPMSPRSNSRGDGGKKATRQSKSRLYSEDDAQPSPRIAWNSNPSQLQNPESLIITKVSSIQQVENPFINSMAIDSEAVAQLMSILKEKLHNKAEIIYQQAIEGTPAPDLIAANKVLVSQIQTLESLQTSIVAYESCATHKELLKQRLVHAISEGSDPTSMPELARSQDLEAEMRKIEVQARELLLRAGIFDVACEFSIDNLSTWLGKYHVLK
jgi:bloom syndrome protein